jgi:hypothetical protein
MLGLGFVGDWMNNLDSRSVCCISYLHWEMQDLEGYVLNV